MKDIGEFSKIIDTVTEMLSASPELSEAEIVPEYRFETRPYPLAMTMVTVGLLSAETYPASLGDYLGDSGDTLGTLWGRKADITLSVNVYAPVSGGGAGCFKTMAAIVDFLMLSPVLPSVKITCSPAAYDDSAEAYRMDGAVSFQAVAAICSDDDMFSSTAVRRD